MRTEEKKTSLLQAEQGKKKNQSHNRIISSLRFIIDKRIIGRNYNRQKLSDYSQINDSLGEQNGSNKPNPTYQSVFRTVNDREPKNPK